MSWLQKLLPPRIKRTPASEARRCPKACGSNARPAKRCSTAPISRRTCSSARSAATTAHRRAERIERLLDAEGRFEIGAEVVPVDSLKFKDQKRYPERLEAALEETGETDALVVMQGSVKSVPLVLAAVRVRLHGRLDGLGRRRAFRARRARRL